MTLGADAVARLWDVDQGALTAPVIHGVDDASLGREVDVQVLDLEERRPRRH